MGGSPSQASLKSIRASQKALNKGHNRSNTLQKSALRLRPIPSNDPSQFGGHLDQQQTMHSSFAPFSSIRSIYNKHGVRSSKSSFNIKLEPDRVQAQQNFARNTLMTLTTQRNRTKSPEERLDDASPPRFLLSNTQ